MLTEHSVIKVVLSLMRGKSLNWENVSGQERTQYLDQAEFFLIRLSQSGTRWFYLLSKDFHKNLRNGPHEMFTNACGAA